MKAGSQLFVLLFVISRAATLPFSVRSIKLDGGTNDTVDDIVRSKIRAMKTLTGINLEENFVKFFVVTSNENEGNLAKSDGNVFFLFHDWSQSAKSCPWYPPLTKLLLKKFPTAQVVQMDYGDIVAGDYEMAVFSSGSIGLYITHMIHKMVKQGTPSEKIVLIGHSLGAQVAGWAAKGYRDIFGEILPRIIALDPAAPVFADRPPTRRLNKHDAKVVMVVHSDITFFGFPINCGTIDFYPNGGTDQPGCPKADTLDPSSPEGKEAVWCNHRRADDIFIAALENPNNFLATQCGSNEDYREHKCDGHKKVSMGDWETNEEGSYYLDIVVEVPFIKRVE